jgi:hypothetical protein
MSDPTSTTWLQGDLESILAAIAEANRDVSNAINTPEMALYQRGFSTAIRSMAIALRLKIPLAEKVPDS